MTEEKIKKVTALYNRREYLKQLLDIEQNYDSCIEATFSSQYNKNTKVAIKKSLELPIEIRESILNYVRSELDKVNKELELL